MAACELVIFDCDGVLVDSEVIAAEVETEFYGREGFDIELSEFVKRFAGLSTILIIKEIEGELGRSLPESLPGEIDREINARLARDLKAIAGAHDVLDMLDQPRAVCSNSGPEGLEMGLRKTGLWDRFRPYVYSSRAVRQGHPKPHPDVYLHTAEEFGVDPRACAVLEDSIHGVKAAAAAGMRVAGFTGGSHTFDGHGDMLIEAGAETVIKRIVDFRNVVDAFEIWDGISA